MAVKMMIFNDMGYEALAGEGGRRMIGDKLEELAGKQGQAADALYLLLDGLEREGMEVTKGPAAAETFVDRLRVYMGAFHLIADTLEATGEALEELGGQMDTGGGEQHG